MASPEANEIFDWAQRCEELFRKLLSTLVGHSSIGTHYRLVRDYSQRFELWAGFIGVFADGTASLDDRLRFYPEVRDLVLRMLRLLERNLSHGFWFGPAVKEETDGKDPPIIVSETSISLAAAAALDAIQEAIDRLSRLAVLIRKSPSSSLTSRVEAFARKADPAKIEEFQRVALLFVTGRLPGIDSGLATQLVSSISFRRLRLLYQGKHNEKLKGRRIQAISIPSQSEAEMSGYEEDVTPTEEYLPRSDILQTENMPTRSLQQPTISETENSGLDLEKFQLYNGSTDISDTSTITSVAQGYSYPPQPRPERGDRYCACNWCSDEIKVSNLDIAGWWRAHFKKDLQPYVCVSEACSEPAIYFTSFSQWRKHMDDVHTTDWARTIHSPQVWYCDVSPHDYLEFREKVDFEHHLKNQHSNDLTDHQLRKRLARNVLPSPRKEHVCPLCNQDILKIYELQGQLLIEEMASIPEATNRKSRPYKGSKVRFQDVEETSSSDEETSKYLMNDTLSSLNTDERKKLDLGKVSKHIAGHLKSLAFLSIRYLGHDAIAGEGDSGKAASGANDADIEGSNRTDKATERILEDFPEAAYEKLEFDDIQAEKTDGRDDEHFKEGVYEEKEAVTTPTREIEKNDSLEEEQLQIMAERGLSDAEEKCHKLFRSAANGGYGHEYWKRKVETRAKGTCQWFLRHENFKDWLEQDSGLLLVIADPGCGKSVLAKHLIDEALPRSSTICYFFFVEERQNTLHQVLRALLHQLFCYRPSLVRHAMPDYAERGQNLVKSASLLWDIFEHATHNPVTGPLIIVLDAMDECVEWDMRRLIQKLKRLRHNRMKFLLTSRPRTISSTDAHIETEFKGLVGGFNCIHMPGEEKIPSEEVHHLIKSRVEQLTTGGQLSTDFKDYLVEGLLEIANPTYLWIYLVFEYLKTVNLGVRKEVETAILSLPKNIYEAYEYMLNRKPQNRPILRKGLSILLAARNQLTISEMDVAMSINKQDSLISDIEPVESEDLLGAFVSIRSGKIDFIHKTAREFLLVRSPATVPSMLHWQHSITIHYAHLTLAKLCVQYLNFFNSELTPLPDAKMEASPFTDRHAFVNYSAKSWGTHFHEANIERNYSEIVSLALKICDPGSRAYSVWSKIFEADYKQTPLLQAAKHGQMAVVRLLLDRGASLTSKDNDGQTPLSYAIEFGHVSIVRLLLERGIDLESKNPWGQTPLSLAAEKGHVALVKLLLDKGADIEPKDKIDRTPLFYAAEFGHEAIVRLLLDGGANIESKNCWGHTPLFEAGIKCHKGVVQLLCDRGADLPVEEIEEYTADDVQHEGIMEEILSVLRNEQERRLRNDGAAK